MSIHCGMKLSRKQMKRRLSVSAEKLAKTGYQSKSRKRERTALRELLKIFLRISSLRISK